MRRVVEKNKIFLKAFTLAEVLIVLGIIGLIADMTIPTLVASYQKQVVVTRMQKMYSSMNQAMRLSEIDNGAYSEWSRPTADYNYDAMLAWYKIYFEKYIRVVKYEQSSKRGVSSSGSLKLYFSDGSALLFLYGSGFHIWFYPVANNDRIDGRDVFLFVLQNGNFMPYGYQFTVTREGLMNHTTWGCKNGPKDDKRFCAALIMYDGWKISPDYPVKF